MAHYQDMFAGASAQFDSRDGLAEELSADTHAATAHNDFQVLGCPLASFVDGPSPIEEKAGMLREDLPPTALRGQAERRFRVAAAVPRPLRPQRPEQPQSGQFSRIIGAKS